MEYKKVVIITQARVGSTRFPAKVLKKIGGDSLLAIHLRRLSKSILADVVVVATTLEEGSDEIVTIAQAEGALTFKGSTNDVLDRFYQAAKSFNPDYIVRVTSDCPLIDAILVDEVISMAIKEALDYCSNGLKEEFPDGQDVEVFTFRALEKAWKEAQLGSDREHVTPYIRRNSTFIGGQLFTSDNFDAPGNFNHVRMTVDEPADLEAVSLLVNALGVGADWRTYTNYILNNPSMFNNQKIIRNEGYLKSIKADKHD